MVSDARSVFDEAGRLVDEDVRSGLDRYIELLADWLDALSSG
jgi:hypothetical protein